MKRVLSFVCLFSFALAVTIAAQVTAPTAGETPAGQATAQAPAKIASDADYATHMKEIGQLNGMLGKAIKGSMTDEASKAATRLEVLFKNIHGYWSAKKVDDATTAAQTAVTSLQEVQKALAANDLTAAETARAKFAGTCMTCHTAHREKLPEGGFRIK
jgi:multidrug resistance efflux pump